MSVSMIIVQKQVPRLTDRKLSSHVTFSLCR